MKSKKSSFSLLYKGGERYQFEMDFDQPERVRIEQLFDNYFATGAHCHSNIPLCTLRYDDTNYKTTTSTVKEISFVDLSTVMIRDIDRANYRDEGGSCENGVDYGCFIDISLPNPGSSDYSRTERMAYTGAWSHRHSDDFSSLVYAWQQFKKDPSKETQLKWLMKSECQTNETTLYLKDFDTIHSLTANYYGTVISNPAPELFKVYDNK